MGPETGRADVADHLRGLGHQNLAPAAYSLRTLRRPAAVGLSSFALRTLRGFLTTQAPRTFSSAARHRISVSIAMFSVSVQLQAGVANVAEHIDDGVERAGGDAAFG